MRFRCLALLCMLSVSCAKGPLLVPDDPLAFDGFGPVPDDTARVLFLRPNWILGFAALARFDMTECSFHVGPGQFAVCDVSVEEVEFIGPGAIERFPVDLGAWTCLRMVMTDVGVAEFDCLNIEDEIRAAKQVWTNQSETSSKVQKPKRPPGAQRPPRSRKGHSWQTP